VAGLELRWFVSSDQGQQGAKEAAGWLDWWPKIASQRLYSTKSSAFPMESVTFTTKRSSLTQGVHGFFGIV